MKDSYINDFKDALKKENLKFTNQRYSILKFLLNNDGHYDCDDIIRYLNKNKIKVSKATTYRTLDLLVKYDFCRKMVLDDGIARYENKIDSTLTAIKNYVPTEDEQRSIELFKLTKKDQVNLLMDLGVSSKVIKSLKYEEDRVKKIMQLQH